MPSDTTDFIKDIEECIAASDLDGRSVNFSESSFGEKEILIKCWNGENYKLVVSRLADGPGFNTNTGLPNDATVLSKAYYAVKTFIMPH
jgi:hypothetical protein